MGLGRESRAHTWRDPRGSLRAGNSLIFCDITDTLAPMRNPNQPSRDEIPAKDNDKPVREIHREPYQNVFDKKREIGQNGGGSESILRAEKAQMHLWEQPRRVVYHTAQNKE